MSAPSGREPAQARARERSLRARRGAPSGGPGSTARRRGSRAAGGAAARRTARARRRGRAAARGRPRRRGGAPGRPGPARRAPRGRPGAAPGAGVRVAPDPFRPRLGGGADPPGRASRTPRPLRDGPPLRRAVRARRRAPVPDLVAHGRSRGDPGPRVPSRHRGGEPRRPGALGCAADHGWETRRFEAMPGFRLTRPPRRRPRPAGTRRQAGSSPAGHAQAYCSH